MKALLPVIAAAYDRVVDAHRDPGPMRAWRDLADHSARHASIIRSNYLVLETTVAMPYASAEEMFADLDRGSILVSSANSDHPLWSVRENMAFRLCHDVMGHYAAHRAGRVADFSWEGELNAFEYHASTLPRDDRPGILDALFTEVVGQAAYAIDRGKFAEQKCTFLW
jgi:hypothetical protein